MWRSAFISFTHESPSGFGRNGERVANTPTRVLPPSFGGSTVVARIAAGESAADAEAEFMTDEYFEAWYQSLCDALRQYEG